MRPAGGLTLVELMIAVALVAILAGVSVPYLLVNLPAYRANGATRQLVGDFRLAKTRAVERGVDVLIAFAPGANTYTVAFDINENGALDAAPTDEPIKTVNVSALYKGIEFTPYTSGLNPSGDPLPGDGVSFEDDLATFYPSGGARPGAAYVRPSHDAGVRRDRERGVTVTATTGRARAYQWNGSAWE
jgi:prepilin-type N-terminal cleavage/methylation domain-containing protein